MLLFSPDENCKTRWNISERIITLAFAQTSRRRRRLLPTLPLSGRHIQRHVSAKAVAQRAMMVIGGVILGFRGMVCHGIERQQATNLCCSLPACYGIFLSHTMIEATTEVVFLCSALEDAEFQKVRKLYRIIVCRATCGNLTMNLD